MKKQMIRTVIDTLSDYLFEGNLDEAISYLQDAKDKGANYVEIDKEESYGSITISLTFYSRREETDEEFGNRLQKEKQLKIDRLHRLKEETKKLKKELE